MYENASVLFVPAMAIGVVLSQILCAVGDPRSQPRRALIAAVTGALAVIFILWRLKGLHTAIHNGGGSVWLYVSSVIDILCLLDFMIFILLLSRFRDRRRQAERFATALSMVNQRTLPHVDVWIATYNEEWTILEKVLVGAASLDWPEDRLHVYILDDGRRPWLEERCAALGVRYLTRPDNTDRKAGNHNNALAHTSSPFILSLDADFVIFPRAIRHMVGFFSDPAVGIVQSPQVFRNPEPFRNNLLMQRELPDDLDMFYKIMQPGRDAWNAAFYCGTSAMLRRDALVQAGGFATQSDIEDQITSMKLYQKGWTTVYLAEQLSVGLAPESVASFHDQRNRWCRGSLQILFTPHGPFAHGFSVVQRLLFSQTYWLMGAVTPLWYVVLPALVWLLGPRIFADAPPDEIIAMPVLLLAGIWTMLLTLGERTWLPIISPACQLFMAVEMLPTALASLLKPYGKPLIAISPVTAKGTGAIHRRVDWLTFSVLLAIILGTIAAVLFASFGPRADTIGGWEMVAALMWTVYVLAVLSIALLTCFELPYIRAEQRVPVHETMTVEHKGRVLAGIVENLSVSGVMVRLDAPSPFAIGDALTFNLAGLPPLSAHVARAGESGRDIGLVFAALNDDSRPPLIRRVYLGPEAKVYPVNVRGIPVLRALLHRFMRRDL